MLQLRFISFIAICLFAHISWAEPASESTHATDQYKLIEVNKAHNTFSQSLEPDHPVDQQSNVVQGKTIRVKRSWSKQLPEVAADYMSATGSKSVVDDWRQLSFVSGSFSPKSGIDPKITMDIFVEKTADTGNIYCFLLMDEYLSQETRLHLESLGVVILGPHADTYKVKVPANMAILE